MLARGPEPPDPTTVVGVVWSVKVGEPPDPTTVAGAVWNATVGEPPPDATVVVVVGHLAGRVEPGLLGTRQRGPIVEHEILKNSTDLHLSSNIREG